MTSAFEIIKENLLEKKYSFLDIDYLKSEYKKEKDKLDFVFDNYIIIGIGEMKTKTCLVTHTHTHIL